MINTWVITSLLLLRSCTPGFSMDDGIVGGNVSIPHSRPYMVYIRDMKSNFVCDGFLVREDFVMTAAHCDKSHLKVYLGVNDTRHLPEGIEVKPFPKKDFSMINGSNDIMLLKLKTPATLNKTVNTVPLPKTENDKISRDCMVMGWGCQDHNSSSPSSVLKEANVTLVYSEDTDNLLYTKGLTGAAPGDSGGPIVCGDVAHGIVSFYTKESKESFLTRYTQIRRYLKWIHSVMDGIST